MRRRVQVLDPDSSVQVVLLRIDFTFPGARVGFGADLAVGRVRNEGCSARADGDDGGYRNRADSFRRKDLAVVERGSSVGGGFDSGWYRCWSLT